MGKLVLSSRYMKNDLLKLAAYLSELYAGLPVSQEIIEAVSASRFDLSESSDRHYILSTIDTIMDKLSGKGTIVGTVEGVGICQVDDEKFGISLVTNAYDTVKGESSLSKFMDLIGISDKKSDLLNFGDLEETSKTDAAMEELSIINQAVMIIKNIESTHTANGSNSSLLKYIPQIEKFYLKPYLNLSDDDNSTSK